MDAAQWPKVALVYDFHKEIGLVNPREGGSGDIVRSNSPSAQSKQDKKKTRLNKDQALNCPRCNSTNTKFCYYNNYNPTQPRYLCKACRRYWTQGGTLRNVPVGGSSRKKNKTSLAPSLQSNNSKLFLGLNPKPTTMSSPNFLAPAPPARSFMHDNNNDLSMGLYYANVHHHFLQIPPTFELSASQEALSSYHVPMSLQAMSEANTRLLHQSSSGFHFQDIIKPTLNLCKDEGFGGTSLDISNTEGAQRIPYSFEELKQDSSSRDHSNNGVVYWNNHGLYN